MLSGLVVFTSMLHTLAGYADKIDGWLDMLAMLDGFFAILFSLVGSICCFCWLAVCHYWIDYYWLANLPAALALLPG
jgi:hypothetical protein